MKGMRKKLLTICVVTLLACRLFAQTGSFGTLTAFTSTDSTGEGSFNFLLNPSLDFNNFSMMFNILLKGTFSTKPLKVSFDFSNYIAPERENGESNWKYSMRIIKQYSNFIKTMYYGNRFDFFYFRYGKLDNITLGDGALLSSYFDNSVGYLESRPGFNMKIGPIGHIGFELVSDDLYEPSMIGARGYMMPFAVENSADEKRINRMQWAYSFLFDPRSLSDIKAGDYSYRNLFEGAFEIAQPLFSGENGQTTLFMDFLTQGEKDDLMGGGKAFRAGIWGRTKQLFLFNISATAPYGRTYYSDYFTTGYNDPNSNEYDATYGKMYPLDQGAIRFDSTIGLNMDSEQIYAGLRFRTNLSESGFSGQRILSTIRIDKLFKKVISLDLNYEKIYPSGGSTEQFFQGLFTLKNVYIYGTAQIRIRGVQFYVTGQAKFDEEASVTYQWNVAISIVFV